MAMLPEDEEQIPLARIEPSSIDISELEPQNSQQRTTKIRNGDVIEDFEAGARVIDGTVEKCIEAFMLLLSGFGIVFFVVVSSKWYVPVVLVLWVYCSTLYALFYSQKTVKPHYVYGLLSFYYVLHSYMYYYYLPQVMMEKSELNIPDRERSYGLSGTESLLIGFLLYFPASVGSIAQWPSNINNHRHNAIYVLFLISILLPIKEGNILSSPIWVTIVRITFSWIIYILLVYKYMVFETKMPKKYGLVVGCSILYAFFAPLYSVLAIFFTQIGMIIVLHYKFQRRDFDLFVATIGAR